MRKHGLKTLERDKDKKKNEEAKQRLKEEKGVSKEENKKDEEQKEENKDGDESNSKEESEDSETAEEKHRRKLGDNSWRFEGDLVDNIELIKDPEILEKIRQKKEEERNYFDRQNKTVLEHLKADKDADAKYAGVVRKDADRDLKPLTNEELLHMKFTLVDEDKADENEEILSLKPKAPVRVLTGDERRKFIEMQKIAEHQKMVQAVKGDWKNRSDERKSQKRKEPKALEVALPADATNYTSLVDQQLAESMRREELKRGQGTFEDDLDELVSQINLENGGKEGSNKIMKDEGNQLPTFSLDDMIKGTKKVSIDKRNKTKSDKETKPQSAQILSNEDDEFLDEILG